MEVIRRLQSEDLLKVLGEPVRLEILRRLLSQPATLSQLGQALQKHPAQIRNHIMQLQEAGMVELSAVIPVKNYTEKYYRPTARAFFINLAVLPLPQEKDFFVALGSDDLALEYFAQYINRLPDSPSLYVLPVGSLDGLIYLREKYCQVSGIHLLDPASGEYNTSFVHHLFPDQRMMVVTLSHRSQGLLVKHGNPHKLQTFSDLTRQNIRFINRKRGTGTRLLLEQQMQKEKITPSQINGYEQIAATHLEVAQAIDNGQADVGLGIFAAARSIGLDFIPLFKERYDLVMTEETFDSLHMQRVIKYLHTNEFRQGIKKLGGYDTTCTGDVQIV